jgi:hypothetical protein
MQKTTTGLDVAGQALAQAALVGSSDVLSVHDQGGLGAASCVCCTCALPALFVVSRHLRNYCNLPVLFPQDAPNQTVSAILGYSGRPNWPLLPQSLAAGLNTSNATSNALVQVLGAAYPQVEFRSQSL